MGLKEKSKVNTALAYELKEIGDFNSSVNRFYYAIFQKLSDMATTKLEYQRSFTDGSSHESLIHFVERVIDKKKSDDSSRLNAMRAMQVIGSFRAMKKLRIQADYLDLDIESAEMDECIKHYEKFNLGYSSLANL